MTLGHFISLTQGVPLDTEIVIKKFGDIHLDDADKENEDDTFEEVANFELEKVNGKDAITMASH